MKMLKIGAIMIFLSLSILDMPGYSATINFEPKYNDPALNIAMGADVAIGKARNGALVNQLAIENAKLVKHQTNDTYELIDGVYIMPGEVINSAFIVAPEGVIVWETGESMEDGKRYREEIRKITDKPIKAVIYSHRHYCFGTSSLIETEKDVMIIAHPNLNKNIQKGAIGSVFPELGPLFLARAMQQINNFLPKEGPDAYYGITLDLTLKRGFVPVNKPVENGENINVAGIDMQFFTDGGSDTDDCTTVWVPSKKLILNNLVWPMMPNLATPRGAPFRDPRYWVKGLSAIRDLNPEYLISQHGISLKGRENIRQQVMDHMDFLNLVLDQTLRGILKGLGQEQLVDFVAVPPHLKANPWLFESYGILSWIPPYIMSNAVGFWDGDAATLFKLPQKDIAERLVPALGGRNKIVSLSKDAQIKKEYAWALELLNYVLAVNPNDQEARALKAEIMIAMGHSSTDSISRAYLLTQARAILGKGSAPTTVPPPKILISSEPDQFVNFYRVRIDPMKAKDTDRILAFNFKDKGKEKPALHIRKGVCEYIPNLDKYYRSPDITLTLNSEAWAELYLNEINLDELLQKNKANLDGDLNEAKAILNLFDKF